MGDKILSCFACVQGSRPKRTATPLPAPSSELSQPSSPLMASSSNTEGNYDVFLSFRGTDVWNNFLGHLYAALKQEGIYTYVDREELRKGEQITPALMKAIQDSRIAIIIFSVNYASSWWCLEEVAKIMECKEQRDLVVFPVFYKVDPREVRTPRQIYRKALVKHERKFGKDSEEVKRWKKALLDAGSLSGWDFNDEHEADLIKRIVKDVSMQLRRTPLDVAKHPVGIHPRIVDLESMLNLESDNDVLMIGLWGQGGIGKTTLAKALYNDIFRRFEASCFLANVRETSKDSKDLVPLQKNLLSQMLRGEGLPVFDVARGINLIKHRLGHKKVLLVLDDVNDEKQLHALAREHEWFGKGSRIIITTRDKHLLTSHEIDKDLIYEVKTLENREALELFNKHAFLRNNKIVIRWDLVKSALHYANGLPLVLEVLGSFLRGRSEQEWEDELNKLAKIPKRTINDVLKLSYNGLEDHEKEIFLDIACFFKGQSIEYITKVLKSCDFNTTIGVHVLVERALITIRMRTIQMHDLIQLMGMDIVKQECPDDPRGRSRLWLYEDVYDVLSRDMGPNATKAIVLDLPKTKVMYIGPNALRNMGRLRLLIMINVHNSFQGPIHLPNELKCFQWPECASSVLEFPPGPKKLVRLDLHKSNVQVAMNQFKGFENLKFLNFSECPSINSMPDLDLTPNLEELDLHGCKNLERAHKSVANHAKLRLLDLKGCSNLHHLPDVLQSKNLQLLNLNDCSKLQRFPVIPDKIKGLQGLYLEGTSIEELPASIENLVFLENLDLRNCKKLANLPFSIYKLPNLMRLILSGCSKLIEFPKKEEDLSDSHSKMGFPKLQILDLGECNLLVEFLENHLCFPYLRRLCHLPVSECQRPQEIGRSLRQYLELVCTKQFCSMLNYRILLPGGEMPEWILPNKEGYISVTASKDLYKKFLVLAICVVLRAKEGEQNVCFDVITYTKRKIRECRRVYLSPSHSDNVCFFYLGINNVWREDDYSASASLQCGIQVSDKAIVKKCGFRLICKLLEDNLKALSQNKELLDSGLLYEICHDAKEMTTEEKTSADRSFKRWRRSQDEDEGVGKQVYYGDIVVDSAEMYRYIENFEPPILPGGDMPEGFVLVEGSTISFMVSQGFYDKFQGLALCVVFSVEDGEKEIFFDIMPHINGRQRNGLSGSLGSFDSDSMWIQYLKPNILWGVLHGAVDFLEFDEEYLQFSLTIKLSGGSVEKLGYVLRCMQMDDNLKAVLKDNQLIDPASIYELEWSDFECKFLKEVGGSGSRQMDDNLKAVRKDNQLINPASIYELEDMLNDNKLMDPASIHKLELSDFECKFLKDVGGSGSRQMDNSLTVMLKGNRLIDPASIYQLEWSDSQRKFLEEFGCQMEEVEAGKWMII